MLIYFQLVLPYKTGMFHRIVLMNIKNNLKVNLSLALALITLSIPSFANTQSSLEVSIKNEQTIALETIYVNKPTNTTWEHKEVSQNFYSDPYQISIFSAENGEDGDRLWSQTKSIFGYGFVAIGIIALLPEDVSNWDHDQGVFNKWSENVTAGPVWDRDNGPLNLIGHPYFGGAYYQSARKSGYRQWDSFVYSALMSTFYWEYGIESFAEVPSIQDLVITPVLGWAVGEWAYTTEMSIRGDNNEVLGSTMLGSTALALLDPVDSLGVGLNNLFGKQIVKAGTGYINFDDKPVGSSGLTESHVQLSMTLQLGDGGSYSPKAAKQVSRNKDPVDTGMIGLSIGAGQVSLDDAWQLSSETTTEYSLGLYFSKALSARVSYSKAKLNPIGTSNEVNFESYSLDAQYYFFEESRFRPYLTAGFGENMFEKDLENKYFQVNVGTGLHIKLNNNFAIQTDWRHYHSTISKTDDDLYSARIVYYFGQGER